MAPDTLPPASTTKAIGGAERLSADNPLSENGFRVPGLARSKSDSRLQRLLQRGLRRRIWMRSDGRNGINSRTIEISSRRISPLRMIGSTPCTVGESHGATYAWTAASAEPFG